MSHRAVVIAFSTALPVHAATKPATLRRPSTRPAFPGAPPSRRPTTPLRIPRPNTASHPAACAPPPRTPVSPLILPDGSVGGENRVGVFAVYCSAGALQYVGISRDVATSLRRALARRPALAHGFSAQYFARPSRVALAAARDAWVAEAAGAPGCDGGVEQAMWEGAVDVRGGAVVLEVGEREEIEAAEPDVLPKVLKKVCRRVQEGIETELKGRGLVEKLKFAPKLKAQGLLDVESVKVKVPESIGASTAIVEEK